jgi:hypothetical protein
MLKLDQIGQPVDRLTNSPQYLAVVVLCQPRRWHQHSEHTPGTLAATVAVITVTGCSIFMAFPGFLVNPAVRTINAAERAQ